jgi:hypothetical protein
MISERDVRLSVSEGIAKEQLAELRGELGRADS